MKSFVAINGDGSRIEKLNHLLRADCLVLRIVCTQIRTATYIFSLKNGPKRARA